MRIFDKIFGKKQELQEQEIKTPRLKVSADTHFVEEFTNKGGKFLYCTKEEEVLEHLGHIFKENKWDTVYSFDKSLDSLLNVVSIIKSENADVFFSKCEHLIVNDASILFSSNQLKEIKLAQYPINFIVFAKTSQLIHDKDDALTSIKHRFKDKIPSNISAIKDYSPNKKDSNFLNYGNNNSKNLYLLLLEDL